MGCNGSVSAATHVCANSESWQIDLFAHSAVQAYLPGVENFIDQRTVEEFGLEIKVMSHMSETKEDYSISPYYGGLKGDDLERRNVRPINSFIIRLQPLRLLQSLRQVVSTIMVDEEPRPLDNIHIPKTVLHKRNNNEDSTIRGKELLEQRVKNLKGINLL
ncbi:hypothetical protein M8C21_031730 [Ambrosia artemisiifolia]|uniref:Uncharacterized protein n=1 Tax=Ambrosia artemisiifolia TaxID=4212 RepID=A0AAD5DAV8_AMBAR|nr:hypothetical protein M8C21_031730 [Ambrosia artemisiifolia]